MKSHPRRFWSLLILVTLLVTACGTGGRPKPPAPEVQAYLDEVLDLIQEYSIKRDAIDWEQYRAAVLAEAAGVKAIPGAYPAVREALRLLDDGHSIFMTPAGNRFMATNRTCVAAPVETVEVPSSVGYVRVRSFEGSRAAAVSYASRLQDQIRESDTDQLTGWIVDLRGNTGGNMWPMLAGVGPILGEGVIGYSVTASGFRASWGYLDGHPMLNGEPGRLVDSPYRLKREAPRVAVLTDNYVGSAGEVVAVAFRGRPETRFFGTPTCGQSTVNSTFPLSDGSVIAITSGIMMDRTETLYGDQIHPDELITSPDEVLRRAIEWLETGN